MLVLTRQKNQKIIVEVGGLRMTITLADIRGDKVKLGFEAPREFKIIRQELEGAVVEENRASTHMRADDLPPPESS
jgi:carbon storage regulator